MLASLLCNLPVAPDVVNPIGRRRRTRRWKSGRRVIWDETAKTAKELYEHARDVVPKPFQMGILAIDGYAYLPPVEKVNFEELARQADVLMALASEIEKQYSREAKRRQEEDLLIQIFLN